MLFYKTFGEGQPLLILHGLFGSSDNWTTLAKQFAETNQVWLIDQRNHGRSFHCDEFDYWAMSDDLLELIEENELENIILLGHSMGGKTAMTFTQQHPEYINKLIVADIGPKQYPIHHQTILKGLNALNFDEIKSRKESEEVLSDYISDASTRQFLLKNLYWEIPGKKLNWRFNLHVLSREIHNIVEGLPRQIVETKTLFIRGLKSDYILDEDIKDIKSQFINSEIKSIENAGHWLHAEAPETFKKIVTDFINT